MRHVIVSRVVVSLAVLFAAAVALFAWGVTRPVREAPPAAQEAPRTRGEAPAAPEIPAAPSGEELFARHCGRCHGGEEAELAAAFRSDGSDADPAAATARLAGFLVHHHGPSPEGNIRIAEHLLSADAPSRPESP